MKTLFVNGGSRGIGESIVRLFSDRGYAVAFTYLDSVGRAEKLASDTGSLALRADSACESETAEAVRAALSELGHIDVLVNNAAISSFSLFTDIEYKDWRRMMDVNVGGAFLYSKLILPGMISRKSGKIINISSMWGIAGASCEVHYSASKAALIGMTKALAREVGPSGITVNAVAPGLIDTEMNRALSAEDIAAICDDTPLMRMGRPEEIAECVYFLAESTGDFITGQVISPNGGLVI